MGERKKPVSPRDAFERAQNLARLIERLAKVPPPVFKRGEIAPYRRRVLEGATTPALRKKVVWLLRHFAAELADAGSFAYLRGADATPTSKRIDAEIGRLLAAYADAEDRWENLARLLDSIPGKRAKADGTGALLEDLRDQAHLGKGELLLRRVAIVAAGRPNGGARSASRIITRLGNSPTRDRRDREFIEREMKKRGFSDLDVAIVVDGPSDASNDERALRVRQRRSKRKSPGSR